MPEMAVLAKVKLTKSAEIQWDGKAVTIDQLKAKLAELKGKEGLIWYHREKGPDASPEAAAVEELIKKAFVAANVAVKPIKEGF